MWNVVLLDERVEAELQALPAGLRARFVRIAQLIESLGLELVREPYVKHLEDKLWEIRVKGAEGIARAIYITATGQCVVVLRVFEKKTQKTPLKELEIARNRAKECR